MKVWQYVEWAKDQPVKPASRKLILRELADYANERGDAWPSQSLLAEITSLSEKTVGKELKALAEEDGLISVRADKSADGTYSFNVYRLLLTEEDARFYGGGRKAVHDARNERVRARAVRLQKRPANGTRVPSVWDATNGSFDTHPTELFAPIQRNTGSVKPKREPKKENPRVQISADADICGDVEEYETAETAPDDPHSDAPAQEIKTGNEGQEVERISAALLQPDVVPDDEVVGMVEEYRLLRPRDCERHEKQARVFCNQNGFGHVEPVVMRYTLAFAVGRYTTDRKRPPGYLVPGALR